ncbi:IclR family transcriptional regulator [Agromyces ramosus]|uniref:DNA-binding IclR family transcriptional regulator n=1 Tax=Agromyces ramosus TaxID=33879 RepID=A0ABU0RAJ5_9MICO|nr:helix-turn-helix domain-containing protein [Agromyces ramosus]MDQ0895100.1 DNA-binding IclR family transcriptional regulator [Agromyces ramosus]
MPERTADRASDYSAPALDKALDILELLAGEAGGLTQTEIAQAVGRNVSQIYRVLATLERRGYLTRDGGGRYVLSMALFDLAHRHPPLRGLVQLAAGPMRELADTIRQSCNLSVDDAGAVRIIAQAESPADFGYQVRVGARFPLESTATGVVLSAGSTDAPSLEPDDDAQLSDGYLTRPDRLQAGITDVVVAITGRRGETVAALTVPYIGTSYSAVGLDDVVAAARTTAAEISARLGGGIGRDPVGRYQGGR